MTGRLTRAAVTASVAVALVVAAGCQDDEATTEPSDPCASVVSRAADSGDIREQIELLDEALVVCRSILSLDAQLSRYPTIIGYDTQTFVANRCATVEDDDVQASSICSTASAPATTAPDPAVGEVEYVGQTLDGRTVTIVEDADTPFVQGNPEPIVQIVDIASEDGCPGVQAELERWSALVGDPAIGDEASVYAQHATNVLAFIGC